MNSEILVNFSKIAIVLLGLITIIISIWRNFSKRTSPTYLLPLLIALFFLSMWSLLSASIPTNLITIASLLILIYTLLSVPKKSKTHHQKTTQFDQAQLIRSTQEQERSRIYANLHDDVGAKLLELIYSAQDDKTKSLAKDILAHMRQAVAQTQNIQCTLKELIHSICHEAKLRLEVCDINLNCENHIQDEKHKLSGTVPSVVERICREIINNIIKHSQASDVIINFTSDSSKFSIKISDNGIGLTNNTSGKGLRSIEKRALKINAKAHWQSEKNKGTQFTLTHHYGN